tara:strand:- start:15 stop:377 length:363 start_codon:yes stop_codon:yes gene_type:complete
MSGKLIYVDDNLSLVIPQGFNAAIFGEDEPTYPCFDMKVGRKAIRLERSGEHPYNEIDDEVTGKPSYRTWWDDEKYEIIIPSYYLELIDASAGDAYEVKVAMVECEYGSYAQIKLTKVNP